MEKELPQLLGSPKQVKWAEDIRSEVLRLLEKCRYLVRCYGGRVIPFPENKKGG